MSMLYTKASQLQSSSQIIAGLGPFGCRESVFDLLKEVQNKSFWIWIRQTCQAVTGFWRGTQQKTVNLNYNAYGSSKGIIAFLSLFWIILYLSCHSTEIDSPSN